MTLEAVIQENTAAIQALIETLKTGVPTTTAQVAAVVQEVKPEKTVVKKPAAEPVVEQAKQPAPEPVATQATATVGYQDAAGAITKLSRVKGRDTAVALLAKFGAANLKEVKQEQYAEVIAAANEAMGA